MWLLILAVSWYSGYTVWLLWSYKYREKIMDWLVPEWRILSE